MAHVRHHRILVAGVGQLDRLGLLREQIDHWRAAKRAEVVPPQGLGQTRQALVLVVVAEQKMNLDPGHRFVGQRPCQTREIEEQELLGEGEVLVQQAVADEGALGVVDQPLVRAEADRRDGVRGQTDLAGLAALDEAHRDPCDVVEQHLVERMHQAAFAIQEQPQAVEAELAEIGVAQGLQAQAQLGHMVVAVGVERGALQPGQLRRAQCHGPDVDRVAGTEAAEGVLDRARVQGGMPWQVVASGE